MTLPSALLLPKSAYTSQSWFEREQATIFENNWQFAGFTEDLPAPGDFLTVQAGRTSIMIIHGPDGELRAFHNMCRHRGTRLLRTCGKAGKAITCPYHDWSYDFKGNLIAVPQQKEEFAGLDKSKLSLHPAQVSCWDNMIWIHPDPEAPSLQTWLQGIEAHLGPHRVSELVEHADTATSHDIQANWKLVVENYIDGYHLSHLHSTSLNMYDHKQQQSGFCGPHFHFYEPLAPDYAANVDKQSPLPVIDHFTPEKPLGAYVPMLFPCFGIGADESSWSIFQIIPLAVDKTRVITRTRVMPASDWSFWTQEWKSYSHYQKQTATKADKSNRDGQEDGDDPLASGDFMAEDIYVCEQQQKSLASPWYSVGAYASQQESAIREFHRQVLQAMKTATD
ncbi:aromatic ring-hydroxylating oxygenase subunit alpha [Aliamphritea spongicola]|uniref:aromatic ring-hydroxylating oxygenase subunit alpha n=1 Tax=Aliamphritea spongicola TaxID=707589 RepID=UPI00196B4A6E|nr:aromatic ring-hydroxylating dioxygenase subunit alpha [Aliamphritea spongicola]MBN3561957.1 aromatic ring-hydroxylating dioxygenase subunit alpha [Aliamphritea spongicola]